MTALSITLDLSGPDEVLRHLQAMDDAFRLQLSARVNLADYAAKLSARALRVEAWQTRDDAGNSTRDLAGLVAVYCNAPDRAMAFVTNVSVMPAHRRKGLARQLLDRAIDEVRARGFAELSLEVDGQAHAALQLYQALGFQPAGEASGNTRRLTLILTPPDADTRGRFV